MEDVKKSILATISMIIIFVTTIILVLFSLTGCTYSITMVHTEGQATDVVDSTATNTPSTSVSIPVSVVP